MCTILFDYLTFLLSSSFVWKSSLEVLILQQQTFLSNTFVNYLSKV